MIIIIIINIGFVTQSNLQVECCAYEYVFLYTKIDISELLVHVISYA